VVLESSGVLASAAGNGIFQISFSISQMAITEYLEESVDIAAFDDQLTEFVDRFWLPSSQVNRQ
jgi:hypothetical protein